MSQGSDMHPSGGTAAFDLAPLGWVKGEIESAIRQASDALAQFAAAPAESHIKSAQTHLHQAHGALQMVGLDGVTRLSEELEGLLGDLGKQAVPRSVENYAAAEQGFRAIVAYLDRLMAGGAHQPLRLYETYGVLLAARGRTQRADPADLYFPDLSSLALPFAVTGDAPETIATEAAADQADATYYREQRVRYQRALLKWLKADPIGIEEMRAVVAAIGEFRGASSQRAFWWVAQGFFDALAAGALPPELDARRLCNRIEQQLRRLAEGSKTVAERLMREALYFVARAASASERIEQVKATYHLASTIPSEETETVVFANASPALLAARELVDGLKEDWNQYAAAGSTAGLSAYREAASRLHVCVDQLSESLGEKPGGAELAALARELDATGAWLDANRDKMSEAVALEVATALLLLERSLAEWPAPANDLPRQTALVCARLEACMQGKLLRTAPDNPLLGQIAREAQERLVLSQVIGDMQSSLRAIEKVLDGFFRNPSQRSGLTNLEQPMQQLLGALDMLGEQRAHDALATAAGAIGRFAAIDYEPRQEHFEAIAQTLSGLGVYIRALPAGNADFDAAMNPIVSPAINRNFDETQVVTTLEAQLFAQQRKAERLFEEWKQRPDDLTVRFELKKNLHAIRADAGLGANAGLESRAADALDLLQRADDHFDQTRSLRRADPSLAEPAPVEPPLERSIAAAIDRLSLGGAATPAPSAEALAMLEASDEAVDAGLIEIYLEEAELVLATISENLSLARGKPEDAQVLGVLRRSFHTLKGSGRMVGLTRLGEAAWAVEQTLNLWLEQRHGATDALLRLIGMAYDYFADGVRRLRRGELSPNEYALVEFAENVRAAQAAGVSAEVQAEPEAAPVAAQPDFAASPPDVEMASSPAAIEQASPGAAPTQSRETGDAATPEDETGDAPPRRAPASVLTTEDDDFDFSALEPDEPDAPQRTAAAGSILIGDREISATLFELFTHEARAHLSAMKQEYEMLIQHGIVTDALMRAAHTLGGIAGTVQIEPLRALGHTFERALQQLSLSELSESEQDLVREALETIESMVDEAIARRMPELRVDLAARLEQAGSPAQPEPEPEWLPEEEAGLERDSVETPLAPAGVEGMVTLADPALEAAAAEDDLPPQPQSAATSAAPDRSNLSAAEAAERRRRRIDDDLSAQVLPVFLEEAHELVPLIGAALRDWRGNPGHAGLGTALQRLLHTLKGGARMAGAMSIGELSHHMETRVEQAMTLDSLPASLFEDLETSVDRMGMLYERLSRPGVIEASVEGRTADRVDNSAAVSPGQGENTAATSSPAMAMIGRDRAGPGAARSAAIGEPPRAPMLRVPADAIDRLVNEAGEVAIARSRIESEMRSLKGAMQELTDNVQRLRTQLREIEIQADSQMQSLQHEVETAGEEFDPLEFDRFTRFQEVTRLMAESVNDVQTVHQNLMNSINETDAALLAQARLNRDLQHDLMRVRMVPFASLSERLYRIVRQSAKELGKRVNLDIRGTQVELDRSVLERITAPLEHLLRNAVGHGLEMPAERVAQGKPEYGEIRLELAQEGNEVQFAMYDDGAGIDIGRVRAKAVAKGLMGEDETLSESQIADFIFHPGFSTARELTQLAGRGIGMDVVKSEVAGLGGRVELRSSRGKGLCVVIYLPLTLAVTHAVLVRAGARLVAIPGVMVEQVQQYRASNLAQAYATNQVEWQSRNYPLHYLPLLLGDAQVRAKQRRFSPVLFLRSGANAIGLHVDEIVGSNQEVVVKTIGPQLARLSGVTGATVLGSGEIVLIINPVLLAARAEKSSADSLHAGAGASEPGAIAATSGAAPSEIVPKPAQRSVMVVDDSLTVRKITGRLLTRQGYQVVVAKDGVDAMEKLKEMLPDVMLVDIEMPRMDGFDLTRTVRADARLAATPIIMISSRTAEKHQNYAREIGVDAFLGKPFPEDQLLKHIAALIASGRTQSGHTGQVSPRTDTIEAEAAAIDAALAGESRVQVPGA